MSQPIFAVVGHPNKGKSSIVATLAQDDSVRTTPKPGTTVKCRHYPMRVDGQVLYTLVDTPGFQRARRALAWMKQHETSVTERPQVVRAFVETHRHSDQFPDECELLGPLIDGAGILYVVDGSRLYGEEYESEMDILRWTGQPSMALINSIGCEDYIEQWTTALDQYFKVVRAFNAFTAEFAKRLELLNAFAQLRESWMHPLRSAVANLKADRIRRRTHAARSIAEMIVDMLRESVTQKLADAHSDLEPLKATLGLKYKDRLRKREQVGHDEVERIYTHHKIQRRENAFEIMDEDLFSQQSWLLWGLTRKQLVATGALSGALLGGGIDATLGGASFMVGTALGVLAGGASVWFTYDRVADVKMLGLALGGRALRIGPTQNPNFPFVVLGRALLHHGLVADRTHALPHELEIHHPDAYTRPQPLKGSDRKALGRCFTRIRRSDEFQSTAKVADVLTQLVDGILAGIPSPSSH